MILTMTLASAAEFHSDGTYSILNAGITRFADKTKEELTVRAAIVVRIKPEHLLQELGIHELTIKIMDAEHNAQLESKTKFKFEGRSSTMIMNLGCTFKASGKYEILLEAWGKIQDIYPIEVEVKDVAKANP